MSYIFSDLAYFGFSQWCFIIWIICYLITIFSIAINKPEDEKVDYIILSFVCLYLWPIIWFFYFFETKKESDNEL